MNYDTKFYSQNCPHNKKFDRSLAKIISYFFNGLKDSLSNKSYGNCNGIDKYFDLDIFLNLLSIFFTSQNYIIITLVNTMQ